MVMASIRIFEEGKRTRTSTTFPSGKAQVTITEPGGGRFLESRFATLTEAEDFCRLKLKKDPLAIFLLFDGESYAQTVFDQEYRERRSRRGERNFGLLSLIIFSGIGLAMSLDLFPNHGLVAHLCFTLGIGVFSICLREFMGRGNFEGAITTVLLLILLGVGVSGMHGGQKQHPAADRSSVQIDSK